MLQVPEKLSSFHTFAYDDRFVIQSTFMLHTFNKTV